MDDKATLPEDDFDATFPFECDMICKGCGKRYIVFSTRAIDPDERCPQCKMSYHV